MNESVRFIPGATRAPRNHWYVVAYAAEVGRELLARQVLGDRLVLFRTESGVPVALEDRCAHRGVALSKGKLLAETVECIYHGVQFGHDGACTHIPSQSAIPGQMCVRSYPLLEKGPFVWAWMGEASLADPASIPDHDALGMTDPSFIVDPLMLIEMKGNHQLLHENLLDTSHISFLHAGFLDSGLVALTEPRLEVDGPRIRITREIDEVMVGGPARFFEFADGTRVRRTLATEAWATHLSVVTNEFVELYRPEAPRRIVRYVFPITPQTLGSSWMFPASVKNFGDHVPEPVVQMMHAINTQDLTAIESSQEAYNLLGADAPDVSVKVDAAALRYRRVVAEVLARDDALQTATKPAMGRSIPVVISA